MGLFAQLEKLHRQDRFQQEDFHTEIVAQVLRNSRQLTVQWLRGIGATTLSNPDSIIIATQEEFDRLAGHTTDSRPDIAIRVVQGAKTELILIESKLGSKQGSDQLQRYAEHLTARELENTALVFITRDYEGAADPIRLDRRFKPARWFEFYRYLKAYGEKDALTEELKLFMEENHMSLGNQFRAVDVVALENFLGVRALMDETLAGEVTLEAKKILGDVSSLKGSFKQLRDYARYTIQASFGNRDFYCLIGYQLPNRNPDDPVWAGVVLTSDPRSKIRSQVITAFRGLVKDKSRGWTADGLDDEKDWCELSLGKPLNAFLSEEDHVRAIKSHFIGLLREVSAFKKSNPRLPWSASAEDVAD
jgi:hypothetical protein